VENNPFRSKLPATADAEIVSLDRERRLRVLFEEKPDLKVRRVDLQKGDRLVNEGDEGPHESYVVFEG